MGQCIFCNKQTNNEYNYYVADRAYNNREEITVFSCTKCLGTTGVIILSIVSGLFLMSLIGGAKKQMDGVGDGVGPVVVASILVAALLGWTFYKIYCIKIDKPLSKTSAAKKLVKRAKMVDNFNRSLGKAVPSRLYFTPAEYALLSRQTDIRMPNAKDSDGQVNQALAKNISCEDPINEVENNSEKPKKTPKKTRKVAIVIVGAILVVAVILIWVSIPSNKLKINGTTYEFRIDQISFDSEGMVIPLMPNGPISINPNPLHMKIIIGESEIESTGMSMAGLFQNGELQGYFDFKFPPDKKPDAVVVYTKNGQHIKFSGKNLVFKTIDDIKVPSGETILLKISKITLHQNDSATFEFVDMSGNTVDMPDDWNKWFANAEVTTVTLCGGIRLIGKDSNKTLLKNIELKAGQKTAPLGEFQLEPDRTRMGSVDIAFLVSGVRTSINGSSIFRTIKTGDGRYFLKP